MTVAFQVVCGPKFTKFQDGVGDPSWFPVPLKLRQYGAIQMCILLFPTPLPDRLFYNVSFGRYSLLCLEDVEKTTNCIQQIVSTNTTCKSEQVLLLAARTADARDLCRH